MNVEQARFNMIEQQIRPCDIAEADILETIKTTPREQFVDDQQRALAFADTHIKLPHDQVMMTPIQEAKALQALDVQKTDRVLEIGTGSGYFTALLAKLSDSVVSEELYADLSSTAAQRLAACDLNNIELVVRDSLENRSLTQRFDRIVVTGSLPVYDPMFQHQLSIGGRLFVITGTGSIMQAHLITRTSEREWLDQSLFETYLPALVGARQPQEFTL